MITMLELFSGSGVLSDAFRRKGIQCVTLDNDPKWSRNGNHHCMTIAQLRKHIEDGAVPEGLDQERDIVFAAPCW
jgi:site-specific DNA-cytosine methylase